MLEKYFQEEEIERIKKIDNVVFKSLELVTRLFSDKLDKGGIPYSVHLLTVYSNVTFEFDKACALLHDTIEDTDITKEDLKLLGFSDEIIDVILILTKNKGDDYQNYIERIINSGNVHALRVKLADLKHNMDIKRIKNPTVNDYDRITKRYVPAYEKINAVLIEMEK